PCDLSHNQPLCWRKSSKHQPCRSLLGYWYNYPYVGADVTIGEQTSGATVGGEIRGIGAVNALGYYTLAYTNFGLYSGGAHYIRSAYSTDGLTSFWCTGAAGGSAIKYVNITGASYANGNGVPGLSTAVNGPRAIGLVGANLVFSDAGDSGLGGLDAFAGAPTSGNSGLVLPSSGSPNDFAVSPDQQTVYIADDQPVNGNAGGGIQRWDTNASGGYTLSYVIPPTAGTNGARGMTVVFPSGTTTWGSGVNGAVIYATTAAATTNSVIAVTDTGAGSTPVILATAGASEIYRGIRFGPAVIPLSATVSPTTPTVFVGGAITLSASETGDAPFSYQWQLNGVNLTNGPSISGTGATVSGSTTPSLVVSTVNQADQGSYTVIVSTTVANTTAGTFVTVAAGPAAVAVPPQSKVDFVGDHLALVATFNGSLPIAYQWYLDGTNSGNAISGQTTSILQLSNIQASVAGTYYLIGGNQYATNVTSATLGVLTPTNVYIKSTNLMVARVGDGVETLSSLNGNTLYLDQFQTNGTYVSSLMVPDTTPAGVTAPGPALIVSGGSSDGIYESVLTLSSNQEYINFAGFNLQQPYTGNAAGVGAAGVTVRGIGTVDAFGYYTLAYTNVGLYSGGTIIRSAASLDGLYEFWTTGQASGPGAIKYVQVGVASYATGNGVPALFGSASGTKVVGFGNIGGTTNLAYTDVAGIGLNGLFTSAGAPTATQPTNITVNVGTGSPNDFAISPDGNTIYIADDDAYTTSTGNGGIERWDTNSTSGGFTLSYSLRPIASSTAGVRGLAVSFPSSVTAWGPGVNGAVLFATTAENPTNRLISIVDNGSSSVSTILQTAGAGQMFRGVRFGPAAVGASIVTAPQGTNLFSGQDYLLSAKGAGIQ
ncbi:MAG TPA: immunoglobulin domain-containing protein, partial [Candidatus Saccharimonadales bacterium]|nr:immunoglobulin domain-containing protein [Candidatus Saccharimonadales bacterium]